MVYGDPVRAVLINGVARLVEHFGLHRSKRYLGAAICHYPFDRIGPGPQWWLSGEDFFLEFFLGMIEQGKHESCSAAEVTENGAFPHPGAGGDGVHCQRRGRAGLCDQVGRGIE